MVPFLLGIWAERVATRFHDDADGGDGVFSRRTVAEAWCHRNADGAAAKLVAGMELTAVGFGEGADYWWEEGVLD